MRRSAAGTIAVQIKEVGSGAVERELREKLMAAARRREIDVVLVWRLDRWGRSLADLVVTLKELAELGVGFVSLTEALDLTTPTGRAMAGLLSVFAEFEHEILRERIRAGIAEARLQGKASRAARDCRQRRPHRSGNSTVPASAKPRSPAASISAAPPCAASWLTYSWQKYVRHEACKLVCRGFRMPMPDPNLDQLLRTAIEQTRLLRLRYRNKDRIVEPHDYGEHNGIIKLLTYQVGGSSSGPLPNWRWMETDLISDARTARSDVSRRPPHGFRQTSQMGQAVPQGQTGRQKVSV